MAYKESIKKSLAEYRDARELRREVLGPDLVDTVVDISKQTAEAAKQKAQDVYDGVVNKVQDVRSKATDLRQKFRDYLSEKKTTLVEGVRSKIDSVKDAIAERFRPKEKVRGEEKLALIDRVRGGIDNYKYGLAERLYNLADRLRGEEASISPKLTTVPEEPKVEDGPGKVTPTDKEIQVLEEAQIKVKDTKKPLAIPEELTAEQLKQFAQYYYNNHDRVRDAVSKLDMNPDATAGDYMIASGFATFMQEVSNERNKNNPLDELKSEASSTQVHTVMEDMDALRQAQTQMALLDQERVRLESQIKEISEKYDLDPEVVGEAVVGKVETAAKTDEQIAEKVIEELPVEAKKQVEQIEEEPEEELQKEEELTEDDLKEFEQVEKQQEPRDPQQEFYDSLVEQYDYDPDYVEYQYGNHDYGYYEITEDDLSEFQDLDPQFQR